MATVKAFLILIAVATQLALSAGFFVQHSRRSIRGVHSRPSSFLELSSSESIAVVEPGNESVVVTAQTPAAEIKLMIEGEASSSSTSSELVKEDGKEKGGVGIAMVAEIRKVVKEYGMAGVVAILFDVVFFNLLVVVPVSLVIFHQQSGIFIPTPATSSKFTATLGSVYLFCKFPPIEAFRIALAFKLIPWINRAVLPEDWRTLDIEKAVTRMFSGKEEEEEER
jgi:hypothetical protein